MKRILFSIFILEMLLNVNVLQGFSSINLITNEKNVNTTNNDDKIHTTNKIIKIWIENDGLLNTTAEIKDNKEEVKISVFNMLGKEVFRVYQGFPLKKDDEGNYKFTSSTPVNLFNNVYILVIESRSYKIADKFIISR